MRLLRRLRHNRFDAMPRSAHMLRWEEAGERILPAPTFNRLGEPKRFTRY
jgi:hypothetical protein